MFPKFPLDSSLLFPPAASLPSDLLAAHNAAHQCANDANLLLRRYTKDAVPPIYYDALPQKDPESLKAIAELKQWRLNEAEEIVALLAPGENAHLIAALEPVLTELSATGQANPQFGNIAAPTWHEVAFKWRESLIFLIRVIAESVRNDKVCAEAQAAKRRPPDGYYQRPITAKDLIDAFEVLKKEFEEFEFPSLTTLTAAIQLEARAAAAARDRTKAQMPPVKPGDAMESRSNSKAKEMTPNMSSPPVASREITLRDPDVPEHLVNAAMLAVPEYLIRHISLGINIFHSSGMILDLRDQNGILEAAAERAVFRLIELEHLDAFRIMSGGEPMPCMLSEPGNLNLKVRQSLWEWWQNTAKGNPLTNSGEAHKAKGTTPENERKGKRTRGRQAGSPTRNADLKLWRDYQAANNTTGIRKAEFVRERGLDAETGLAALDRGRKAAKPSGNK